MSVLNEAKWIFADIDLQKHVLDRYFDYIASFCIKEISEIQMYISAYSQYVVYVNGKFVDCGQYDDYEDLKFYDVLNITDFVKEGNNTLLVQQYVCGGEFATKRSQVPGVIFCVTQGERILLVSGEDCASREHTAFSSSAEILTPQLGYNFEYNSSAFLPDFHRSILVEKSRNLHKRPIHKLVIDSFKDGALVAQGVFAEWDKTATKARRCQHAFLSMCEKKDLCTPNEHGFSWKIPECQKGDGAYFVFDMGGESAGLLQFDIDCPNSTEVLIAIGEHLDDLRVRSAVGSRNFAFRYIAKQGNNHFLFPFQRLGLRYIQVMFFGQNGAVHAVGLRPTTYPLTYLDIPVKDGLHRMIWKIARKTLELCMHEHYEDCPWREQSLYAMDSRVQILCGYYAFGEYDFPRETLRLMAHSLREDKMLELCPPGRVPVNIPSFTAVFVREVLEYIQYSKDTAFASEMLPVLTEIVQGFESHRKKYGLLPQLKDEWNFYEWRTGLDGAVPADGSRYDCLLNAFVSDAFRCYSEICRIAGNGLADEYDRLHKAMNQTIHHMFWRGEAGGYATYLDEDCATHELTQAMLLYVGAVPQEHRVAVAELIKSKTLIPCSLSMTIYAYDALLQTDPTNYDYVINDIESIWEKMLRSNTDTFWETEKGSDDFNNAGSLCHGWSAVPIYIFAKYQKSEKNSYEQL